MKKLYNTSLEASQTLLDDLQLASFVTRVQRWREATCVPLQNGSNWLLFVKAGSETACVFTRTKKSEPCTKSTTCREDLNGPRGIQPDRSQRQSPQVNCHKLFSKNQGSLKLPWNLNSPGFLFAATLQGSGCTWRSSSTVTWCSLSETFVAFPPLPRKQVKKKGWDWSVGFYFQASRIWRRRRLIRLRVIIQIPTLRA